MSELKNLWSKAKSQDVGGYSPPKPGVYAVTLMDIVERVHEGKSIFDLIFEADSGQKITHGIWDLDESDYQKLGETKFLMALSYRKKMVVDLGQPEPDSYEDWLQALSSCVGARAELRVVASTKDSGKVVIYVNPPSLVGSAGSVRGKLGMTKAPTSGSPSQPYRPAGGVPF
jgi:hypothetical protein